MTTQKKIKYKEDRRAGLKIQRTRMKKRYSRFVTAWPEETRELLPGSYQNLDLFIKVLWILCPNLTDASKKDKKETGCV